MIKKVISYKLQVISFLGFLFLIYNSSLITSHYCYAQQTDKAVEFILDASSTTQGLPGIFSVNLNLDAGCATLERIEKDLGFNGVFRLKWDFWQIGQLEKDKEKQKEFLEQCKTIIKKISAAKGKIIISFINTPPGMGRALDKRSAPEDIAKWRELVKETIRDLSCENKYNIWYEVWDNPVQEESFLGTQKDYLNLYKAAARAILELEKQYSINIPLGAPAVKNWYDNFGGNNPLTPERSLIYDMMRFCSQNNLPLDFISWQASSMQADQENQVVAYNRKFIPLVKEWLTYFGFKPQEVALVIDVDNGEDIASFIPARMKNMQLAGAGDAVFHLGDPCQKQSYQALRYIKLLGQSWYPDFGANNAFIDGLATKKGDDLIFLFYSYIDPYLLRSKIDNAYFQFNEKEQAMLLEIIKSNRLKDILNKASQPQELGESEKLKKFFDNLADSYYQAKEARLKESSVVLKIKNIKGRFKYSRYILGESLSRNNELLPEKEEKKVVAADFVDTIELKPYSVVMIVLHKISD